MKRKFLSALFDQELPRIYYELLIIGFNIITGMSLSASFLPILADSLDPQGVLVGLVVSAWFLSRIFIELPAGLISDRIGRRKLIIIGLGLGVVGPIICSQATHIFILIIGRAIWGMGSALYFMSNMALLMDILPSGSRGRALGVFQGIELIGGFIGIPVGAWVATIISFTQVFYITTGFTTISFIIALMSRGIKNIEAQVEAGASLNLGEVSASLRNWNILALCFTNFSRMLIRQGLDLTVLMLYLNKVQELGVAQIGLVVSMKVAGMIIFVFIAGIVSDRYGRIPVLIIGYLIGAASLFMFTWANSIPLIFLSGFIGGIGDGLDMSTLMALLTDLTPPNVRGGAVGLFRTFMDVGGFTGPIIFMIVFTRLGEGTPFYLGISMYLFNILLISRVKT